MARRYSVVGGDTNTAATTMLAINEKSASPTVRARIAELDLSSVATPADNSWEAYLQRITDAGTATSVTPTALDPADAAAECTAGKAHTVEPTYTAGAILLDVAVNLRATWRWCAQPGYEFVCPATASNGIGLKSITAATPFAILATILYEE